MVVGLIVNGLNGGAGLVGGPAGVVNPNFIDSVVSYLNRFENPVTDFAGDYFGSTAAGYVAGGASGVPYGQYIGAAGGALGSAARFLASGGNIRNRTLPNATAVPMIESVPSGVMNITSSPATPLYDPGAGVRTFYRGSAPRYVIHGYRTIRSRGVGRRRWYSLGKRGIARHRGPRSRSIRLPKMIPSRYIVGWRRSNGRVIKTYRRNFVW